ncbi:MAG: hypothetical protein Fur0023_16270 [Bacteroidia bacterium]
MDYFFDDNMITTLINEKKQLNITIEEIYREIKLNNKCNHKECKISIDRQDGQSEFLIIIRKSTKNELDFSVILAFRNKEHDKYFILRRYNGKSHRHTNKLENDAFYDFHIHYATERYQKHGLREDYYAEKTDKYNNIESAIQIMIRECNIKLKEIPNLFNNY